VADTPEAKVKKEIKKWLQAHGIWFYMPVPTGRGVIGVPDFLCCWRGAFVAIEAKKPKTAASAAGRPTPAQKGNIQDIARAGGIALVVHSVAELEEYFHAYETGRSQLQEGSREGERPAPAGPARPDERPLRV
jgi:hypothetical protein